MQFSNLPHFLFVKTFEFTERIDNERLIKCSKALARLNEAAEEADINKLVSIFPKDSIFLHALKNGCKELKESMSKKHVTLLYPRNWGDRWKLNDYHFLKLFEKALTIADYTPFELLWIKIQRLGQLIYSDKNKLDQIKNTEKLENIFKETMEMAPPDNDPNIKQYALFTIAVLTSRYGNSDLAKQVLSCVSRKALKYQCAAEFFCLGYPFLELLGEIDEGLFLEFLVRTVEKLALRGDIQKIYDLDKEYSADPIDFTSFFRFMIYDEIIAALIRAGQRDEANDLLEKTIKKPGIKIIKEWILSEDWKFRIEQIAENLIQESILGPVLSDRKIVSFLATKDFEYTKKILSCFSDKREQRKEQIYLANIFGEIGAFHHCCRTVLEIDDHLLKMELFLSLCIKSCLLVGGKEGMENFKKKLTQFFLEISFPLTSDISKEISQAHVEKFINKPLKERLTGDKLECCQMVFALVKLDKFFLAQKLLFQLTQMHFTDANLMYQTTQQITHWLMMERGDSIANRFLCDQLLIFFITINRTSNYHAQDYHPMIPQQFFLTYEAVGRLSDKELREFFLPNLHEGDDFYSFFRDAIVHLE